MRMYFDEPDGLLSGPELHAAVLDGDLVPLGLGWAPADAIETAGMRAASLRPALGDALAAIGLTAAWVHGAIDDPPAPLTAQRALAHGRRRPSTHAVHVRDALLPEPDQEWRGGVRVSTAARTLVDLAAAAIREAAPPPALTGALHALARDPVVRADAIALARTRRRFVARHAVIARILDAAPRDERDDTRETEHARTGPARDQEDVTR